jgi:glycerol-3-phosphate dehydrogenase
MNREEMLARLERRQGPWDIIVIGGGATGAGVAVDAATRGHAVLLLEGNDFGKGTSSRSTKLVHGGVRYLQQGNVSLVREALRERSILRRNAPHVVTDLPLIVPAYDWWERPYYGIGLRMYDVLAGRSGFGRSALLSRQATIDELPTVNPEGLRGGIRYHDGQFDDARLLVNLVQTAVDNGATVLNYARVTGISLSAGKVDGVIARDAESGTELRLQARVVINATGAFVDDVRQMADAGASRIIIPSQGTHIVLDRRFLPGRAALMVPRVGQGRVMFAIPWHAHALVGTTDTAIPSPELEPRPRADEVDSLLRTASRYLTVRPTLGDVLSVFTGVRPLVRRGNSRMTAALSRDHTIDVDRTGLVTVTGGKWTTYRHMAEQTVDRAAIAGGLPQRPCVTSTLAIHGYPSGGVADPRLAHYGSDAAGILDLATPALAEPLDSALPCTGAEVVWAVRHEMARTIEDVLARRCRALFLDAAAARRMAPAVAQLMAAELHRGDDWIQEQLKAFSAVVEGYTATSLTSPPAPPR